MRFIILMLSIAVGLWATQPTISQAASFDCAKASTAHEKHICNTPSLNALDTQMGAAYKIAVQHFPLNGFVLATQRGFVTNYVNCDQPAGEPCLGVLRQRLDALAAMGDALVYTNQNPAEKYTPENGVFLLIRHDDTAVLKYFGGWMPDAYHPRPFPDGFICDDMIALNRTADGYASQDPDAGVTITDEVIVASISCSARNGLYGDYKRIR